jgi:integrase
MTEIPDLAALRERYPTVKFVTAKGTHYAYDRATMTPIKARPFGSPAFEAETKRAAGVDRPSDHPLPGTLAAAIDAYRGARSYRAELSERTRKDYDERLHWIREAAKRIDLRKFKPADVEKMIERAADLKGWHWANYLLTVLRLVLDKAVLNDWVERNPARVEGIKKIRRPRGKPKANPPWPREAREVVLSEATGGVLATLAIGMFTGMREGDVLRLTEQDYDGRFLRWVPRKTDDADDPMDIPVHPRLKAILDPIIVARCAAREAGDVAPLRLVTGVNGRPYTDDGFRTMLWRLMTRLEREGKIPTGLTFHGLRHSVGTYLAETGASQEIIMAILNHKTLAMSALYTARANKKRLASAAVAMLYPEQ